MGEKQQLRSLVSAALLALASSCTPSIAIPIDVGDSTDIVSSETGDDGSDAASLMDAPASDDRPPPRDPDVARIEDVGTGFDVPPLDAAICALAPDDASVVVPGCASDGGGATSGAPRLVAPLSTSYAMTARPTLRWRLATGSDGAHIEICRRRDCTIVEASYDAIGEHFAVPTDLGAGVHFWRAFSRSGSATSTESSAVWQFHVPAHPAGRDTSWGHVPDFNGDGRPDIAISPPRDNGFYSGRVYVFYTDASGNIPCTPQTLAGSFGGGQTNRGLSAAGDVNGDGFGDLVVADATQQHAVVFLGSSDGLRSCSEIVLTHFDESVSPGFGFDVDGAGDMNGDGYADIVVGDPGFAMLNGSFWVYLGGPDGVSGTRSQQYVEMLPSAVWPAFGSSVTGAGDVNGDGFGDVAVAFGGNTSYGPRLYLGGSAGLTPSGSLGAPAGIVNCAGDLNGDGLSDLLGVWSAGDGSRARVDAHYGDASGAPRWFPMYSSTADLEILLASGAGDVNGDGYADVAVSFFVGDTVSLFRGTATWVDATPIPLLVDPAPPHGLNFSFGTTPGDLNGDGFDDLLVGLPWEQRVYVQYGNATLPVPTDLVLTGAPGDSTQFGASIAGAY